MKKLFVIFLLFSGIVKASGLTSSYELVYIYGTFIFVVLFIVGIDKGVKYIYKKLKERNEILNEQSSINNFEE
jgi:hypothetical protein